LNAAPYGDLAHRGPADRRHVASAFDDLGAGRRRRENQNHRQNRRTNSTVCSHVAANC